MSKVKNAEQFNTHEKTKLHTNLRRKDEIHLKEKRMNEWNKIRPTSYGSYFIQTWKRQNGSWIENIGKPVLKRGNNSKRHDMKKTATRKARRTPLTALANGSYYKKCYDIDFLLW